MKTKQQKIGDRLEQQALTAARKFFPSADLTRASGQCYQDGDIRGLPGLHIECKNSDKPGKGRSVSKQNWLKIKAQAHKRQFVPVHLGFDDEGQVVALIPWEDLVAICKNSES